MGKDHITVQEAGRRGGRANVERHSAEHFIAMGIKGGNITMYRHGSKHYQRMAALSQQQRRKNRAKAKQEVTQQ